MRGLVPIVVAAAALLCGTAVAGPEPARVQVSADEFAFSLSRAHVRTGQVIIQLVNYGEDDHDLAIRRIGGSRTRATGLVHPGKVRDLELRLSAGRYILWCTLPGHRARGMEARLRVA